MVDYNRTLPNLDPATDYVVRVRAYNNIGVASDWSESISFLTLGDDTIPGAPSGVTTNFLGSGIVVNWVPPTTNTDGSPITDIRGYKVTFTNGVISKTYFTTNPPFVYSFEQNRSDFGSVQSTLTISVITVDVEGNESLPAFSSANNAPPSAPTEGPILIGAFTGINITMVPPLGMLDYQGFILEHSLSGSGPWTEIAETEGTDTYFHEIGIGNTDTHYYRYKVVDLFGQPSTSYSPILSAELIPLIDSIEDIEVPDDYITDDMIGALSVNKLRTGTLQTFAAQAQIFLVGSGGFIQSVNYDDTGGFEAGYRLQADKLLFQNGSIEIIEHSVGGTSAISLDGDSFRVVYGGNTRFFVDENGIFFNGTNQSNANISVTSSGVTQFRTSTGTHTFIIDSSATGSDEYLTLFPTGSPSTPSFYLTADGKAYFLNGVIGLGDGATGGFNVDEDGNIWQGPYSSYSAAATAGVFRVRKDGKMNIGTGTKFQVDVNGDLHAEDAFIDGEISADNGDIGGFTIGASTLTAGSGSTEIELDSSAGSISAAGGDIIMGSTGLLIARNPSGAPGSTNKVRWMNGGTEVGYIGVSNANVMFVQADSDIVLDPTGVVDIEASLQISGSITIEGSSDLVLQGGGTWDGATGNVTFNGSLEADLNDTVFSPPTVVFDTGSNELLYQSSSRRWKKNIQDINNTNTVLQLRPRSWKSRLHGADLGGKDSPTRIGYGLIAEETADVDSRLALYDADGLPSGIDWMAISTFMIAELKRLREEFDEYVEAHP